MKGGELTDHVSKGGTVMHINLHCKLIIKTSFVVLRSLHFRKEERGNYLSECGL